MTLQELINELNNISNEHHNKEIYFSSSTDGGFSIDRIRINVDSVTLEDR
jgi:hypothetical protein